MAFEFPHRSVLTAAPKFSITIRPSLGKFTKLYCVSSVLGVFTGFTFAQQDNFDRAKEYADHFFGPRASLREAESHANFGKRDVRGQLKGFLTYEDAMNKGYAFLSRKHLQGWGSDCYGILDDKDMMACASEQQQQPQQQSNPYTQTTSQDPYANCWMSPENPGEMLCSGPSNSVPDWQPNSQVPDWQTNSQFPEGYSPYPDGNYNENGEPCYPSVGDPSVVICGTFGWPDTQSQSQWSSYPQSQPQWDWPSQYSIPDPLPPNPGLTSPSQQSSLMSHEERMIEGIAQEFFFQDSEINFYDSRSWDWFYRWAEINGGGFQPGQSVVEYFALKQLGWAGVRCDHTGCSNMPSSDYIRQRFRFHQHEARHTINTLKALEKANNEVQQYTAILESAKNDLARYCEEFSTTFFHPKTKGKTWMCPAKLIQIILMAIVAFIAVAAIAFVAVAAPVLGMMTATATVSQTAQYAMWQTVSQALTHVNLMAVGGTSAIAQRVVPTVLSGIWHLAGGLKKRSGYLQQNYDAAYESWIDSAFGVGSDAPVGLQAYDPSYQHGAFGLVEGFQTSELNADARGSSIYEQADVKAGFLFRRYPLAQAHAGFETYPAGASDSGDPLITRLTKTLGIYSRPAQDYSYYGLPDEFSVNVLLRLVNEDNSPMDITQALDFFERNSEPINQRWQELRTANDAEYLDLPVAREYFPTPKITLIDPRTVMPWSTVLSNLEFDGAQPINKDSRLQFRSKTQGSWKRSADVQSRGYGSGDTSGVILHEIHGNMDSLEALNIFSPVYNGLSKRSADRWNVQRVQAGSDELFEVDIRAHSFQNEIVSQQCGEDYYTGDTYQNKIACENFLNNAASQVTSKMSQSYNDANASPSTMAQYLKRRFSTYTMWNNVETLSRKEPEIHNKIFNNLKNGLVSKAYADGNCYVRCGKNFSFQGDELGGHVDYADGSSCMTACYDPIHDRFERLYGFLPWGGKATEQPWNLSERTMNINAFNAYATRKEYGIYPGSFNLNPYVPLTENDSPILPVCSTALDYDEDKMGLPCSCGDEFGSMTSDFAQSVRLGAQTKNLEYKGIRTCFDRMKQYGTWRNEPAVYLANVCHIVYTIVTPPGTGSHQEAKDKGHYSHNYYACQQYWEYIDKNKHRPRHELNAGVCMLWSELAKDFDRGINHKHPDMSYANDILEDHACHDWKK